MGLILILFLSLTVSVHSESAAERVISDIVDFFERVEPADVFDDDPPLGTDIDPEADSTEVGGEIDCDNGIDDDDNGLIDCLDPYCDYSLRDEIDAQGGTTDWLTGAFSAGFRNWIEYVWNGSIYDECIEQWIPHEESLSTDCDDDSGGLEELEDLPNDEDVETVDVSSTEQEDYLEDLEDDFDDLVEQYEDGEIDCDDLQDEINVLYEELEDFLDDVSESLEDDVVSLQHDLIRFMCDNSCETDFNCAVECEYQVETSCYDGGDNDGDGMSDCSDLDCDLMSCSQDGGMICMSGRCTEYFPEDISYGSQQVWEQYSTGNYYAGLLQYLHDYIYHADNCGDDIEIYPGLIDSHKICVPVFSE